MVRRRPSGAIVPLSECVVTLESDSVAYTGSARTVGVTVTHGADTLAVNTDYTLSWANNVNVGPATVTVTGMGQFAGSVTKTFYVVPASVVPWGFKIEDAVSVDSKSISTNGGSVLPFMEGYQPGRGLLPVRKYITNNWLCGYAIDADENGEIHISDADFSSYVTNDGSGADGYYYPLAVSPDGRNTYWGDGSRSGIIKQKTGTAFDFGNMAYHGSSPAIADALSDEILYNHAITFADNGRSLFVSQRVWEVRKFSLSTPYDITTLSPSSVSVQKIRNLYTNDEPLGMVFGSGGRTALVSMTDNKIYQFSLAAAYDFTDAEVVSSLSAGTYFKSLAVVNGGKTLLAGKADGIYEYSLPESL